MTSLLTYDLAFKVEPVKSLQVAYATACMTVSTCDRLYDCIHHHSIEYSWKCTRTRTRGNVLILVLINHKCTRTRTRQLPRSD